MQGEVKEALPGASLLAPNKDFAVVARRGENAAVLGVCPGDRPNRGFVAADEERESVSTSIGSFLL